MSESIIHSLWDYFLTCPLMGNSKINVDFLPEKGVEYSIDTTPATEIVKQYVDGSSIRQYLFVIRSVEEYGPDVLQNLSNSGFYENLSAWLERQTRAKIFPILPDGKTPQKIEAQSTGYLFTTGPDAGKYQIQCRLQYFQEG
ncbi:MAG TPA: hypothetical protein IAA80_08695 [Candidatus Gallacutalibacter pullistercoris]|nr:hypothetical protein [Candidatus Gallacutalibacter pullistercoris]